MENETLSLSASLSMFEEGVKLTRTCQTFLEQAEQKVQILEKKYHDDDGRTVAKTRPFDLEVD